MTQFRSHPDVAPEPLVDAMVLAAEAERFERAVLGEPLTQPVTLPQDPGVPARPLRFVPGRVAPSRTIRWGGLAAAAAVVLGVTLTQVLAPSGTTPAGPDVSASDMITLAPEHDAGVIDAFAEGDTSPAGSVRLAGYRPDTALAQWAFLDSGIASGLPTLSDERTLVLAVYEGGPGVCDCVEWSVHDDASASPEVLDEALASRCAAGAQGVTVFAVTGPRLLLPFHDQEARELAMCLQQAPRSCAGDDFCAAAFAGDCVPSPLLVDDAKTFQIASR